jgi:hypothetical protein
MVSRDVAGAPSHIFGVVRFESETELRFCERSFDDIREINQTIRNRRFLRTDSRAAGAVEAGGEPTQGGRMNKISCLAKECEAIAD